LRSNLEVIIVTGLSGSGKSTAIHVLEDVGYYCIDNLPPVLIRRFLQLCDNSQEQITKVALGVDIREREFLASYPGVLDDLRAAGSRVHVLFLDASDEVLVRRFSETRRPHPLSGESGPLVGIQNERERLVELRGQADRILDTSALTVHELRGELRRLYRESHASDDLGITVLSFGFKFGVPSDVDMVLDVRFLANPFFVDELRPKTGRDEDVARYVLDRPEAQEFVTLAESLLNYTLPHYRKEGRRYFTLAMGCTGGRHRSVAVAERIAQGLTRGGYRVQVQHRDVRR
jgi:UPF0042 nucleotide-binding protein